jgi:hypothetical protein
MIPLRISPVPGTVGILGLGAIWIAILVLGFWLGANRLLLATDGRYYLTMATSRVGFDWPWFSDSIDFLHGIGDQLFPFKIKGSTVSGLALLNRLHLLHRRRRYAVFGRAWELSSVYLRRSEETAALSDRPDNFLVGWPASADLDGSR